MRPFRSEKLVSVSSYFGGSSPASRAAAPFAPSPAICTWRARGSMSGYKPSVDQYRRVYLLRFGVRRTFVQDRGEIVQHADEHGHGSLIHRDLHAVPLRSNAHDLAIQSQRGAFPQANPVAPCYLAPERMSAPVSALLVPRSRIPAVSWSDQSAPDRSSCTEVRSSVTFMTNRSVSAGNRTIGESTERLAIAFHGLTVGPAGQPR